MRGTTGRVEPDRSIGSGVCEAARAVGAIQPVFGTEQWVERSPIRHTDLATNVPGVFFAGAKLKADIQVLGLI